MSALAPPISDIVETREPFFGSKCSEIAATEVWRDLLINSETAARLERIRCPVLPVAAERGRAPTDEPVLSDVHIDHLRAKAREVEFLQVPQKTLCTVRSDIDRGCANKRSLQSRSKARSS